MSEKSKPEIWLIDLSGSRGHEQKGQRPAIIWRDLDHIKMAIAIPLTTTDKCIKLPYTHLVSTSLDNGLEQDSIALVFQITTIDKKRLIKRIGRLEEDDIEQISGLLRDMMHL